MARITVEDCIDQIENRFALVLVAGKRTKQLMRGSKYLGEPSDNKYIVNALREIAAGKVRPNLDLKAILQVREDL